MNVIRVMVEVKPEQTADFIAHFKQEAAEVPQMFEGCLKFDLFQSPFADNKFLLYEEWASEANFNAYKESDYFEQNGQKLFPMMSDKPDSAYFQAEIMG